MAQNDRPEVQSHKTDDEAFYWCNGYFFDEDGSGSTAERPTQKLTPFVLEDMMKPVDLVTETEVVGKLPPEVDRYRGYWILPSIGEPVGGALFVERLTPIEITLVLTARRDVLEREIPRLNLKWTGKEFADRLDDKPGIILRVSPGGHAMNLAFIGHNKTSDGRSWSEAIPMCLISSKHY